MQPARAAIECLLDYAKTLQVHDHARTVRCLFINIDRAVQTHRVEFNRATGDATGSLEQIAFAADRFNVVIDDLINGWGLWIVWSVGIGWSAGFLSAICGYLRLRFFFCTLPHDRASASRFWRRRRWFDWRLALLRARVGVSDRRNIGNQLSGQSWSNSRAQLSNCSGQLRISPDQQGSPV